MKPLKSLWRRTPFGGPPKPSVHVIELTGVIGAVGAGRNGLTLARLEKTISSAFQSDDVSAIALAINSPGGSPVQSRLIFRKIRRLAEEKNKPVLVFIEDVGASGGYILSLAGDEIYADKSSIVGSIGVISTGFGFQETIARYGIERRVYTAGKSKSQLDPFKASNPEDVSKLQAILNDLHEQFIELVSDRRGTKIGSNNHDVLFNGDVWTGPQAHELGLIDGIAQLGDFLVARYGKDVKIKRFSPGGGSLLKRLTSKYVAQDTGPGRDFEALLDGAEARAVWARFGL
ncbi:MAG: S49 family peptidase [Pseudomonadota bacterium]